jgi:hypothetical protein
MTEELFPDLPGPEDVAPLVVWLGGTESAHVTGRVFEVEGNRLTLVDGHTRGRAVHRDPVEIGKAVEALLAETPDPTPVYGA